MTVVAAGYVRVSTEEQAREGYGLAAQEQAIRAYCQAQGWELVEVYADAGRSGKSTKGREALTHLLEDGRAGRFQRLIFWKLDRLGRNLRDLLAICDTLESLGVGIVSVQEAIDTGTAAGRMVRSFLGAVAELEREVIVERIKAGLAAKARSGELLGRPPIGYQRDEDGDMALDPLIAPLVRELFVRYASGAYSLRELAQWAAEIGLRNPGGYVPDRDGIRKILTNPTYLGQVAYHRRRGGSVLGKGKHPALVDAALFATVQEMLRERRRYSPVRPFGRDPYPLSGIALCALDGAPLLGVKAGRQGWHYMRCSTAHRRGRNACAQPMTRAELLEDQIAAYVSDMRLPPEYLGEVVTQLRQRRPASEGDADEAQRLRAQLERWRRLYVLGEIDEQHYRQETARIMRALAQVERPLQVEDVERAVGYLRDIGSLWGQSPRQAQREFVKEVFDRIMVDGPQITAIAPKPSYAPLFAVDRRERFRGEMGVVWRPRQDSNLQPAA